MHDGRWEIDVTIFQRKNLHKYVESEMEEYIEDQNCLQQRLRRIASKNTW